MGRERVVEDKLQIETEADFAALMTAIETAPAATPSLTLAALAEVRKGVITGEGPTTRGRVHYSRSIDRADTALVERILIAGGPKPISRAEADALFDIHEAAFERVDGGAFDDLFAKAVAHHVLASAGHRVPSRESALARPLADWAPATAVRGDVVAWLQSQLSRKARTRAPLAALAALVGSAVSHSVSVAALVNLAA
jgi:hypothetical protein